MASTEFWLVVEGRKSIYSSWELNTPRALKKKPSTGKNEVAIKVNIDLPDALFDQPAFTAEIVVNPDDVGRTEVSADVTSNIEALVREQLGIQLEISNPVEDG